jgi:hypothetical protein
MSMVSKVYRTAQQEQAIRDAVSANLCMQIAKRVPSQKLGWINAAKTYETRAKRAK